MSIARPAAEIDPQAWIFSKSWILPGPIRPSASRSIRTLREGSGLAADFCIEDGLSLIAAHIATAAICEQDEGAPYPGTRLIKFRGRHELSVAFFAATDRPLSPQASRRAGAVDAD